MSKSRLYATIKRLGLSELEANVYLTALTLGETTILEIARRAAMHRTTVYAVVNGLKRKGLMHEETKGLKSRFVAESPERLEAALEETRKDLRASLPELMSLYHARGGEGSISFYEGLPAVKNMYEVILNELQANDEYLVISDAERWYALDEKFFTHIAEVRAKKRLRVKLILQNSPKAQWAKQYEKNFSTEVKIVPKEKDFIMSLVVTPRHLFMHALQEPTSAILIKNQRAIDMQRQVFNLMWEALPET
jgi:sugar-specific transcriptional regulator TrmB